MIDELKKPGWIKDLKLLVKDWWFLIRDTAVNVTHLVARTIKVVSLMQLWGKGLAKKIEFKLHDLRDKVWGNGELKIEELIMKVLK